MTLSNRILLKVCLSLSLVFLGLSTGALALTETDSFSSSNFTAFTGNIGTNLSSGVDIALGRPATLSVAPFLGAANGSGFLDGQSNLGEFVDDFSHSGVFLTDAVLGGGSGQLDRDPVFTISLNLNPGMGGSATGYDLSSINSVYGFHNHHTFSDQKYTVAYSTVAAPTVFVPLASVSYGPFNDAASDSGNGSVNTSLVTLTNLTGAVGVADVRFTFSPFITSTGEQTGQDIQELDVYGTPTLIIPEPRTWVLLGLGAWFFLEIQRRKQVRD